MALNIKDESAKNEALLIHDIARQAKLCFDRRVSHMGLTRTQLHVLGVLRRNPGITQAKIADIIEVEPMTLCRLLDRMEKAKWIKRVPDPKDRRANHIMLTEKVDHIVDEIRAHSLKLRKELLKGFSNVEHAELTKYLKRIKLNISEILSNETKS